MRSKERLSDVLKMVNGNVVPVSNMIICHYFGNILNNPCAISVFTKDAVKDIIDEYTISPHIKELLTEALYYLEENIQI